MAPAKTVFSSREQLARTKRIVSRMFAMKDKNCLKMVHVKIVQNMQESKEMKENNVAQTFVL